MCHHDYIAFMGFNREQTLRNFRTFAFNNKDNITTSNDSIIQFKDGTMVFNVFAINSRILLYDYIIVSDDWRMLALNSDLFCELSKRLTGYIPPEFSIIKDDIDDNLKEGLV